MFPLRRLALTPVLLAALTAPAGAAQLPPQGLYESCTPRTAKAACVDRLQRMSSAGFTVVVNGAFVQSETTAPELLAYGTAAHALGIKVMVNLRAHWAHAARGEQKLFKSHPGLVATCGCLDDEGLMAFVVGLLRDKPWFYGYYIADEPTADAVPELAALVERLKALDPSHPRLIMGCGLCGEDPGVEPFVGLDVMLGTDRYPIYGGIARPSDAAEPVERVARQLKQAAARRGQRTAVALQAWDWGDSRYDMETMGLEPGTTRFPTAGEIRAMRDAAVRGASPDLILWWFLPSVIGWEESQRPEYWKQPTDSPARWKALVEGAMGSGAGVEEKAGKAVARRVSAKKRKVGKKRKVVKRKKPVSRRRSSRG